MKTKLTLFAAIIAVAGWFAITSSDDRVDVGSASTDADESLSTVPPAAGQVETPVTDVSVQLYLHGTLDTGDSDTSIATLSTSADSQAVNYRVGEEVPGGGTLYLITDDSVQILTQDALIELTIIEAGDRAVTNRTTLDQSDMERAAAELLANMEAHDQNEPVLPEASPPPAEPAAAEPYVDPRTEAAAQELLEGAIED